MAAVMAAGGAAACCVICCCTIFIAWAVMVALAYFAIPAMVLNAGTLKADNPKLWMYIGYQVKIFWLSFALRWCHGCMMGKEVRDAM